MSGTGTAFSGLLGQEKAKKLIRRALSSERMPHAFLFRGPEGVGKQLFAREMAAAVNCRSRERERPCGACSSCRKFRSGSHPDFMVVSPDKGAIKIEQVRQTSLALSYPPYESQTRVVLIEDVHGMRAEAANCLLKTLEEPPPDNLLILTADSSREILPTLASRCQLVPFYSLSQRQTVEVLLGCDAGLDQDTAELVARLAEGSPGRARLFLQTEMIAVMRKVTAVLSDPSLHPDRDTGALLQAAGIMADSKENLPSLLGLLRLWLRDRLMLVCGLSDRSGRPEGGGYGTGRDRVNNWSLPRFFDTLETITAAERQLARNCNRHLVCEVLLFKLSAPFNGSEVE
ncbi:DNA polymerase-3 subunit delta' [Desulfoprunum benzoelyticum]|uniref:DNA polymerase-3 subunit delta n=2 Tax=Desulfoprunum benzoelyticum TaxID=1506996 RepID=A0A840V101_9BACT|nr:DNA polymerase III subunit delta' [Desulfoprunum benzoelyticum]MBB5346881.1 DNA polymerase-3 subunit delta' [Desulfoprunum benzoelyticum]